MEVTLKNLSILLILDVWNISTLNLFRSNFIGSAWSNSLSSIETTSFTPSTKLLPLKYWLFYLVFSRISVCLKDSSVDLIRSSSQRLSRTITRTQELETAGVIEFISLLVDKLFLSLYLLVLLLVTIQNIFYWPLQSNLIQNL